MAHPDLINYMGPDDVYCRHMRRIVETAVDMDLPLEINLYGFADGRWYPSDRFIKMAAEYHPRFVIGCDAHAPRFIRQPERVEGFTDFLKEYGIECGDNILDIKNMGSNAVTKLSDTRLIISDVDENRFEIKDTDALTQKEKRMLDLFL